MAVESAHWLAVGVHSRNREAERMGGCAQLGRAERREPRAQRVARHVDIGVRLQVVQPRHLRKDPYQTWNGRRPSESRPARERENNARRKAGPGR
eukprot:7389428-Prymnesium_polylepis.1